MSLYPLTPQASVIWSVCFQSAACKSSGPASQFCKDIGKCPSRHNLVSIIWKDSYLQIVHTHFKPAAAVLALSCFELPAWNSFAILSLLSVSQFCLFSLFNL